MELDQPPSSKRALDTLEEGEQAATERLAQLELHSFEGTPAASGGSSEKRQRLVAAKGGQAGAAAGGEDDAMSSLLPLQPLTAEAAEYLHRLGSPELEEEEEAAALAAMLAGEPSAQQQQHPRGDAADASASDPLLAQLSEAFEPLQLNSGDASMSEAGRQEESNEGSGVGALPGSPQHAAAASAESASEGQQRGQQGDPLISHRVEEDCAAPIQMLSLEALSRNPLLQQFQMQRAAAARAEQTARAVAAATALCQAGGLSKPEHGENEVADGMLI